MEERAYLIWGLIDDFCDRAVELRDSSLDLDYMFQTTLSMVLDIIDDSK